MPIVMIMEWPGVTLDQYDQARELVGWEREVPAGGMYHVAAHDGTGMRVTDVWQSAEQFQDFVQSRLMPGVRQIGIQGDPKVEIYPAHRIFTPGYTAR